MVGHRNARRTTLLNIIAGFLPFTGGEVMVDGKSLNDDPKGCQSVTAYGIMALITLILYIRFRGMDFTTLKDKLPRLPRK